ncbi:MAG: homoserine dehydrogenase [Flavobacteriales bacterium]
MTTRKELTIGLFGFGCVGQGLHRVLHNSTGIQARIKTICVKHKNKKRSLDDSCFTYTGADILNDPAINLVVELINDSKEAFEIVSTALRNGKNVVTANKKMIAEYFAELVKIQQETGSALLYEASACGSIPIIRTLEEYYDNETLYSVSGIFNGTTNYILTKTAQENLSYEKALKQAQELGFAELDPKLDVEGYDAKYKLIIIAGHSYGVFPKPDEVLNLGIQHLSENDLAFAKKQNKKIKLVASAYRLENQQVAMHVLPQLIDKEHLLYDVNNEYNAVIVEASFSDKQLFIGKGAGGNPTGSAVLSDISACSYEYKYEYKKRLQLSYEYNTRVSVEVNIDVEKETILPFELTDKKVSGSHVTGFVPLNELIRTRDEINKRGIFVLSTGNYRSEKTKKVFKTADALVEYLSEESREWHGI